MHISKIENHQQQNFQAKLNIMGDIKKLPKNNLQILNEKAKSLGTEYDIITIGVDTAQKAARNPRFLHIYPEVAQTSPLCVSVAIHSFKDLEEPNRWLVGLGVTSGNENQQALEVCKIINDYLDKIKNGLDNLKKK